MPGNGEKWREERVKTESVEEGRSEEKERSGEGKRKRERRT